MKLVILDNGLKTIFAHSFAINKAIARHLSETGIEYQIFATRRVKREVREQLECVPFFRRGLYNSFQPSMVERWGRRIGALVAGAPYERSPSEARTSRVLNNSFEADLKALPPSIWESDSIVLLPGLMQHQLLGVARFLKEREGAISATIICQLMFEDNWLPWGEKSVLGPYTYSRAFDIIRSLQNKVHFTAENEHVAGIYADKFNIRAEILPIPLTWPRGQARAGDPIRLGFLGYSKMEKGFHLLPEAISECISSSSDLEFTVQINHNKSQAGVREADAAIRRLEKVRVIDGELTHEQYGAEFARLDVVLLPYDPDNFGLRGSGVFSEAVSSARVLVASKGTWAGRSIEIGEAAGEAFSPYTGKALAAAIRRVCADMPRHRAEADKAANIWSVRNSAATYVDKLISLAQRSPSQYSAGDRRVTTQSVAR